MRIKAPVLPCGASAELGVPALIALYLEGKLLLDERVGRRLGLTDLNDAFDWLRAGTEARQVVVFDGSEVAAGAST